MDIVFAQPSLYVFVFIVIVQDGKPIERNLHRERLTIGDLAEEARQQQIASIENVKWAVLESNGAISFILK